MTEWVLVNGARIERTFLEENIAEALKLSWRRVSNWGRSDDHRHCIICNVAVSGTETCYRSPSAWLCDYCYGEYVAAHR